MAFHQPPTRCVLFSSEFKRVVSVSQTLLSLENIKKDYVLPRQHVFQKPPLVHALQGIDLKIAKGVCLGIVGESGCGKSTLARIAMGLETPSEGKVVFDGKSVFDLPPRQLKQMRRHFQMVFQDPYGSLNPRHLVSKIVAEPLDTLTEKISRAERLERVVALLEEVGLNAKDAQKYPHQFSGGQRQRLAIARALITRPALIVADEAVSALDVSVQAQVLNLMLDLQEKYNLSYMFISHDLSVVQHIADEVAVLFRGKVVEMGKTHEVFDNPQHSYTQSLLRAIPNPNPLVKKKETL